MEMREFEREPWRLRAVFVTGVEIENDDRFLGVNEAWIWFVGDPILDEWFAHGISDKCDEITADQVATTIEPLKMLAVLAYAGDTWSNITSISIVAFGGQQRALLHELQGAPMETLALMSRDRILALRRAEEGTDDPSAN